MNTVILTTFGIRDASDAERAAEAVSQDSIVSTAKPSAVTRSCMGRLRGHLSGVELEMLLLLQKLGTKHHGVVWCGPSWVARQGLCSRRWAIEVIRRLLQKGWLESVEWRGRRAYRVRTHAEWAAFSKSATCKHNLPCELTSQGVRTPFTGGVKCAPSIAQKTETLARSPFGADCQEVQSQKLTSYVPTGSSGVLEKNISAKIAATKSSWVSYLNEEDEKERAKLRRKFAWVCRTLEFEIAENDGALGWEFAFALIDTFADNREALRTGDMARGVFACKVIDACKRDGALWPPAFTECRDRWRQIERVSEQNPTLEAA